MNPYDFVNSISRADKKSIMEETPNDALAEKIYSPFLTNRSLSYFVDSLMFVQDMNLNAQLDNKLQYDYLRLSLRPMKRIKKWDKAEKILDLDLIKKHFKYNNSKALSALELLTDEQIQTIKDQYSGK